MFIERNPWIVVVGSILVATAAYCAVVLVSQINRAYLLGSWFLLAIVFVSFATVAIAAYRSLRRSRAPAVMEEQLQQDH